MPDYEVTLGEDEEVYLGVLDREEATEKAVAGAITHGKAFLDVLVFSEDDAEEYGGDDAVEQYLEDPDASIHERFEVTVEDVEGAFSRAVSRGRAQLTIHVNPQGRVA